jgi:hypothetical protein
LTEVIVFKVKFDGIYCILLIFRGGPHLQKATNVSLAFDDFSSLGDIQFPIALAGKVGCWAIARRSQI